MAFPVDRFAAYMAHRLNAAEAPLTEIEPGALEAALWQALAGRYAGVLLGQPAYAWRIAPDEAATAYFRAVLERGLWLVGAAQLTVAHRVLLALCQRAPEPGWRDARIERGVVAGGASSATVGLAAVEPLLRALPNEIDAGNAAASARERAGPLALVVGNSAVEVPDQLSVWGAVLGAPRRLNSLPRGEAFNGFCAVLIDAMRTAHRPFQEVVGLGRGLCPFDWLGVLAVNQVRALRRFLAELTTAGHAGLTDPRAWETAWAVAPVPGFKSAEQLWASEIGFALRQPQRASATDVEALAQAPADHAAFMPADSFARHLDLLVARGAVAPAERWLLQQLYVGASLAELAKAEQLQLLLKRRKLSLARLVADLQQRIEQALAAIEEGRQP